MLNATTVQIIWGPPKPNEDGLEICFSLLGGQPKTVYLVADQTEHVIDTLGKLISVISGVVCYWIEMGFLAKNMLNPIHF